MTSLSVDADISDSEDLLGKSASDLQESIEVSDDAIEGTLKYVTGYTGYSGSAELQEGNYLATHAESEDGATISVELIGGHSGPIILESDGLSVGRIESTEQVLRFTAMKAGKRTTVKDFDLSGLTLATEAVALADADADSSGDYSEEELQALTKAQLLELAETLSVTGVSASSTKAQIIAAILAAQEAAAEQPGG